MRRSPLDQYDRRYLRLLKMGAFERRGGAWRFGTNKMSNDVVERLLDAGRVVRDGDRVFLSTSEAAR